MWRKMWPISRAKKRYGSTPPHPMIRVKISRVRSGSISSTNKVLNPFIKFVWDPNSFKLFIGIWISNFFLLRNKTCYRNKNIPQKTSKPDRRIYFLYEVCEPEPRKINKQPCRNVAGRSALPWSCKIILIWYSSV